MVVGLMLSPAGRLDFVGDHLELGFWEPDWEPGTTHGLGNQLMLGCSKSLGSWELSGSMIPWEIACAKVDWEPGFVGALWEPGITGATWGC